MACLAGPANWGRGVAPPRYTPAVSNERGPRFRRGRIAFWVLVGICTVAFIGGAVTAIATARTFTEPSASMENTVRPGDIVMVDRTAQIHRGDVVVEQQPSTGSGYFIRRVIGLPGDHVVCCDARGRITVNGHPLNETYLYPADAPSPTGFNVTVPDGDFWLLGDHRSVARDSRTEGPQAVQVVGRVFLLLRSGRSISVNTPGTFIAAGLASASPRIVPALVGIGGSVLAFILLVALAIFGIIRWAIRRSARSRTPEPGPASVENTWDGTPMR